MKKVWVTAACVVAVGVGAGLGCSGEVAKSSLEDLDSFCDELGRRFCEQDAPCCKKLGNPYDERACRKYFTDACLQGAEVVRRGGATFDPNALSPCVETLQSYYDKCELDSKETRQFWKSGLICSDHFVGHESAGSRCTHSAECKRGDGVGVYCNGEGVCESFGPDTSPGSGDECPGDFCGPALVCDQGSEPPVCVEGPKHPVVTPEECDGTLGQNPQD